MASPLRCPSVSVLVPLAALVLIASWSPGPGHGQVSAQGTGVSVPLSEEELERLERERTRNVVRLAATDQLNSEIITNRTRAYLNCESGEMVVKINFSSPFRGVAYSDYDRSSPCKFYGDGGRYYELRLPLKGCGTKQEAPRLFINNIIVRFHRSLELEEDEIKTIICRYPPPQAPPPPSVVAPILEPTAAAPVIVPAKLSEIELLLIICALLFLTLLLLGIGMAYYCLKRRNIKIVKKKKTFSSAPSEITKLSHSTLFDPIRIPRATAQSSSSETIPSDYPSSESDERRTIVSETSTIRNEQFRFENSAFIPEPYPVDNEREDSVASVPLPVAHMPSITTANFTETLVTTEKITEEDTVNTHHRKTTANLYKRLPVTRLAPSIPDNDNRSDLETEASVQMRKHSLASSVPSLRGDSIPDNDNWSEREVDEAPSLRQYVNQQRQLVAKNLDETLIGRESVTEGDELVTRNKRLTHAAPPKITLHKTDDLFVTNITETDTTEKRVSERAGLPAGHLPPLTTGTGGHQITSSSTSRNNQASVQHQQLQQQSSSNYQTNSSNYQTNSSNTYHERSHLGHGPPSPGDLVAPKLLKERPVMTSSTRSVRERTAIHCLDEPSPVIEGIDELTNTDKRKWVTLVTTDEVFKSMVVESTSVEELTRISRDIRYESLFEVRKWDIIVRVIHYSNTGVVVPPAARGGSAATTRTSGGLTTSSHQHHHHQESASVQTSTQVYKVKSQGRGGPAHHPPGSQEGGGGTSPTGGASRRTSQGDQDMRSLSEEDVDFGHLRRPVVWSRDVMQVPTSGPGGPEGFQVSPWAPPPGGSQGFGGPGAPERHTAYYERRLPGGGVVRSRAMYERAAQESVMYNPGGGTSTSRTVQSHRATSSVGEREEINSLTETDVYDQHWFRQH